MQFFGTTAEECRRWQADFGTKLRSLLGPFQPPKKWECVLESRIHLDDHVREQRVLTATGAAPVPFFLLVPQEGKKRRPGMLAIHGHGKSGPQVVVGMEDTPESKADQVSYKGHGDYGRQLVRRGYIVAAPCLTPFGRRLGKPAPRGSDPCTLTFLRLQYLGKLLIAENLRDILWTLDYLLQHEAVDPQRIGCAGLSYGGRMTMLATALEPRIRAAVVSGALNCFQERTKTGAVAGCQVIPGLLQYGDVPEIGALIAPRPCVWEVGTRDPLIAPDWAEKAQERLRRGYLALGAVQQLHVDRFEGEHQWHGRLAYDVLNKALAS
jgi:dienelactone hydrolase